LEGVIEKVSGVSFRTGYECVSQGIESRSERWQPVRLYQFRAHSTNDGDVPTLRGAHRLWAQ
jgi:hypothetical protein